MKMILALAAFLAATGPAFAQYYAAPPPPPPPGYYPPPGYGRRIEFGQRCDAVLHTPYGRRHVICEIIRPKPLGERCACPPPPPPPGYPPGPFVGGRTVP